MLLEGLVHKLNALITPNAKYFGTLQCLQLLARGNVVDELEDLLRDCQSRLVFDGYKERRQWNMLVMLDMLGSQETLACDRPSRAVPLLLVVLQVVR